MLTVCMLPCTQALDEMTVEEGGHTDGHPRGTVLEGRNVGNRHQVLIICTAKTPWVVLSPEAFFYDRRLRFRARSRPAGQWVSMMQRQPELRHLGALARPRRGIHVMCAECLSHLLASTKFAHGVHYIGSSQRGIHLMCAECLSNIFAIIKFTHGVHCIVSLTDV